MTICHSLSIYVTIFNQIESIERFSSVTDRQTLRHSESVTDRTRPREARTSKNYVNFEDIVTDKPLTSNKQGVGGHNHPPEPNIRLTLDQLQLPLIGKMTKAIFFK